ncbi:hypothetical protein EYC84_010896 [Monilinia fructicola]|uniref:Uncharacterized protein n=1 Tax=Monilinia fructicola TaxID=38448 RepID=A0A5M9J9C3_MONFR|nr:hypothetical protein EYC84_010896 [Monilinia fructicola]
MDECLYHHLENNATTTLEPHSRYHEMKHSRKLTLQNSHPHSTIHHHSTIHRRHHPSSPPSAPTPDQQPPKINTTHTPSKKQPPSTSPVLLSIRNSPFKIPPRLTLPNTTIPNPTIQTHPPIRKITIRYLFAELGKVHSLAGEFELEFDWYFASSIKLQIFALLYLSCASVGA